MGGGGSAWFGFTAGTLAMTPRRRNAERALSPQPKYINEILEGRTPGHKFHELWSTPTTMWLINKP